MSEFKAPLRDMLFTLFELLGYEHHCQSLAEGSDLSESLLNAIFAENARFCTDTLSPLNTQGDQQGCTWRAGEVTTPAGFKEAYAQYCAAGWPTLSRPVIYGGQGLPQSVGVVLSEMIATANPAWGMYPGLSQGTMHTIEAHGSEAQQRLFLPALIAGNWTGTMCLTEAHCGSDLGLLRTRAEPQSDGSYRIIGSKIFISAGEHDLAENIIHIVLARLPDAPEGTKGISLFIVPKFQVTSDGALGERNQVECGSIEHKMGLHGNATCVLNFDGATGYLLGEANKGLNAMFTFMNLARLGTAVQGLGHAELGLQKSLAYARERLQMRSLSGIKNPQGEADPIIVHPDVRRMLLTQKALVEGGRMLVYFAALQIDIVQRSEHAEARQRADELLGLLTPITKAFVTETGFESANLALQCFGGHGYIREWGVEQNLRDCRIATLYEGTTGIQALDLLGRKVLPSQGQLLLRFTQLIDELCAQDSADAQLQSYSRTLQSLKQEWFELSALIATRAQENPEEIGAAAVDYLMYSGYIVLAYFWASAAHKAHSMRTDDEADFYLAKLHTAQFYFERILPRTRTLAITVRSGADNLMRLPADHFIF
jgi:hypothetical protein